MRVADAMTRDVDVVSPTATVREAARKMDSLNVGVLPVCDGRRLVGILTDRDVTVRATSTGESPDNTRVQEVMSSHVRWCYENASAEEAERIMAEDQIRRLPVVDSDRNLVGIVSLGDLATDGAPDTGEALKQISEPSEPDRTGTPSGRHAAEAGGGQPGTPEAASDEDYAIRGAVMEAFAANPDLDASSIHVAVHEGLVRLTGTVGSEEDERLALEIARSVEGTRDVRNDLAVHQDATLANQTGSAGTGAGGREAPRPPRNVR